MNISTFIKSDILNMKYGDLKKMISPNGMCAGDFKKLIQDITIFPINKFIDKDECEEVIKALDGVTQTRSTDGKMSFLLQWSSKKNNKLDISELDAITIELYREQNNHNNEIIPVKEIDKLSVKTVIEYLNKFLNKS